MSIRIAAVDLNGQLRGKRVSRAARGKPVRLPLSVLNVDIEGADIDGSPLVFDSGDQDGVLYPVAEDPVPLPWLNAAAGLQLCTLHHEDGTPFAGDPRAALQRVLARYAAQGWQVRAGVEVEFYLLDQHGNFAAPLNPKTQRGLRGAEILSLRETDGFEAFFNDIETGAAAMGLPDLTITCEAGVGQFEVTMDHAPALTMADATLLLKELIKGTALTHTMTASFMAKPLRRNLAVACMCIRRF